MQQAKEAAAEAEAQRHRRFRLINQGRVVELELIERLAEFRILRIVDREQTRVDHGLRVTVAFERIGRGLERGSDGVAHLGLADVFRAGDNITDLTRTKRLCRHHVWADHADFNRIMGHANTHHVQFLTGTQLAIDHTNVGDDAAVGVVDGVEDQRTRGSFRIAGWCRNVGNNAVEQFGHAFTGFTGHAQHFGRIAADQACDFLGMLVWFRAGKIDFVQYRNDGQIMVDGHIQVRQGLRFDALRRVDKQHCAFACGESAGNLISEIDVAWSVDHAEGIFGAVERPRHAHSLRFDGDATLLLNIHTIQETITHLTFGHDAAELQNTVCHRGLAVIDMRDDAEIANQRLIGETGLVMLLAHAILLLKYSTQTILTASIGMVSRDTPKPVGNLSARHVIIIVCMSL